MRHVRSAGLGSGHPLTFAVVLSSVARYGTKDIADWSQSDAAADLQAHGLADQVDHSGLDAFKANGCRYADAQAPLSSVAPARQTN